MPSETKVSKGKKVSSDKTIFWPYLLVFFMLELIFLVLLTYAIYVYFQLVGCNTYPNFICYDDWYCENPPTSPSSTINPCFVNAGEGTTGMASCLYGVNSALATTCFGPELTQNNTFCNCPTEMQNQTNNCMSQCPNSTSSVNPNTQCAKK